MAARAKAQRRTSRSSRLKAAADWVPPLAARTVRRGRPARGRPVHKLVRATVDAQPEPDRIGSLLRPRRISAGRRRAGSIMGLAAFHAKTASGEGAHGPDRSRLAKWNHCRTHRRKRQYAAGTESAGAI